MVTDGNPLAAQGTDSSMLVGKIKPPEGLFAALKQVRNATPVNLAVLVVFSKELKGRIAIANNRVIIGAIVDGSGETGQAAFDKLMPQMGGMFGLRTTVENEATELQHKLLIDIDMLLMAQHIDTAGPSRIDTDINDVDPTYMEWLKSERNKVFSDIERSMTRANPLLQNQGSAANFQKQAAQGQPIMPQEAYTGEYAAPQQTPQAPQPQTLQAQRSQTDSGVRKWDGLDSIPTPPSVERRTGEVDNRPAGSPERRQRPEPIPASSRISSVQSMKTAGKASGVRDLDLVQQPINSGHRPNTSFDEMENMERRRKLRIGIAIVGVLGACAFINMYMTNNNINSVFSDANRHFQRGEYKETIFLLTEALQKDPNNGRLHLEKGLAHAKLGELDDAVKEYDLALAKGASRVPVLLARATVFSDKKEFDKAISECTTILVSHPDCVAAYLLQATAFDHQSQTENAEKACTAGLKYAKTPDEKAHLLLERGYALARMLKPEEAEKDLSAAIEYSPTLPMYMARGDVYKKLGKYKEAVADYGAVIERDPANYNALVARGIVEARAHEEKAALDDFAEALKINKLGVEAFIQRGSLYLSRHAYHLAVNDFEDAMRLNPQIAETQQKRDFAYKQLRIATPKLTYAAPPEDKTNDVTAGISAKLKLPGTTPELIKLGYKYLNDGELQFAIACFRQAVKMSPQNENARKYLAHAYFEAGESDGAAQQFEALNKISGVDPADILPFSQSLARSGHTTRAIQVLESYLSTNPRATNYRCDLANLYLEAKQPARARTVLAQGLAVPGLSPEDRNQLTSLYSGLTGNGSTARTSPTPASTGNRMQ